MVKVAPTRKMGGKRAARLARSLAAGKHVIGFPSHLTITLDASRVGRKQISLLAAVLPSHQKAFLKSFLKSGQFFFKRVSEIVFCVYEIGVGFRLSAARCSPSPFLKWDFCVYEIRILFYKTVSETSRESSQAMFFNFVSPGGPQFEISERGAVRKIVILSGSPPAHRLERRA